MNTAGQAVFSIPFDCLRAVQEVWRGQYACHGTVNGGATVLDIGANVGAWTVWAAQTWPEASIIAYEPHPDICRFLRSNTASLPNVTVIEAAVGNPALPLRLGFERRATCSQYDMGEQITETIQVRVIQPEDLPHAALIKLDAEGAEGYIVPRLPRLPEMLLCEWHGDANRRMLEATLSGKMRLVSMRMDAIGWGNSEWVREDRMPC